MDCPRCKSPLIVVEYHDIELDWCTECQGLWFDSGEMELLATRMRGSAEVLGTLRTADTSEKRLKCPECGRTMSKRLLGEVHPVVADVCPLCGGLWLDHGELEQVVSGQGAAQDTSPVLGHLRVTFSRDESGRARAPQERGGDSPQ